jgi:hypothetical protein
MSGHSRLAATFHYGHHTYAQIAGPHGYLARCATFAGSSMTGDWEHDVYVVRSYGTCIARYDGRTSKRWLNPCTYSPTTTYDRALAAAWLGTALAAPPMAALAVAGEATRDTA